MKPTDPAFPQQHCESCGCPGANQGEGMTVRAYFAAKAMQGLLANQHFAEQCWKQSENSTDLQVRITSIVAVRFADALLAELAKEGPK